MKNPFTLKRQLKQAKKETLKTGSEALAAMEDAIARMDRGEGKEKEAHADLDKKHLALTQATEESRLDLLSKTISDFSENIVGDSLEVFSTAPWNDPSWTQINLGRSMASAPLFSIGQLTDAELDFLPACIPNPATSNLALKGPLEEIIGIAEGLLSRTLVTTPRVKINILDPETLGRSFARFGKADTLKGGVFETPSVDGVSVSATLKLLSERIQTVFTKFLQGDFESLAEYNKSALTPEDTHILIVLNADSYTKAQKELLERIISMGPRCGIFTLIIEEAVDASFEHPAYPGVMFNVSGRNLNVAGGLEFEPIAAPPSSVINTAISFSENLRRKGIKPLSLEGLLPKEKAAPGAKLSATIGKSGTQDFNLELGVKGAHPHLLVAGRTGSGKSTFLHSLIVSLANNYSPEDLNFYLVDGKQGVEMRNYAPLPSSPAFPAFLPHVKIAAVKSDIRTYISVLEKAKSDIKAHAKVCASYGVSDVVDLAEVPGAPRLPRIVVILDEFHVLLTDPDFGDTAASLLKDLVKQGRAYGIHIVLATQSLGNLGATAQNAAIFGEIGNRVALACDASVSEQILGRGNMAASRLSRMGEAVFTSNIASPEFNTPLQVAFISPADRAEFVKGSYALSTDKTLPFVFSGDSLPSISTSPIFTSEAADKIWLGAPVKISGPVSTKVKALPSGNMLVYGSGEEDGSDIGGVMVAATLSALKSNPDASFIIALPSEDSPVYTPTLELAAFLKSANASVEVIEPGRQLVAKLEEIDSILKAGTTFDQTFLIIPDGSDNLRADNLKVILAKGPENNLHTITAFSSKRSLLASSGVTIFDKALNLFDSRVFALLNASETSTSSLNLPEKPANEEFRFTLWDATKPNRVEVFIPYGSPSAEEWNSIKEKFTQVHLDSKEAK